MKIEGSHVFTGKMWNVLGSNLSSLSYGEYPQERKAKPKSFAFPIVCPIKKIMSSLVYIFVSENQTYILFYNSKLNLPNNKHK